MTLRVVPHVLGLYPINSVVDVGCALGSWLLAFMEEGIDDVIGVEKEWVDIEKIKIPKEKFTNNILSIDRKFDLAVSLEVAEHIEKEEIPQYLLQLTRLSNLILFSAAIPGQGGRGHVNEQWPEYWKRGFAEYNYVPVDCIRPRIFKEEDVCWWYRQNILLYIKKDVLLEKVKLRRYANDTDLEGLQIIHQSILNKVINNE